MIRIFSSSLRCAGMLGVFTLVLGFLPVQAQFTVGNGGIIIKPGTVFSIDGITFNPSAELSFTDNALERSTTPVEYAGMSSVNQVFTFGAPITFAGMLRFPYDDDLLSGAEAENLRLIYTPAVDDPLIQIPETDVHGTEHFAECEL